MSDPSLISWFEEVDEDSESNQNDELVANENVKPVEDVNNQCTDVTENEGNEWKVIDRRNKRNNKKNKPSALGNVNGELAAVDQPQAQLEVKVAQSTAHNAWDVTKLIKLSEVAAADEESQQSGYKNQKNTSTANNIKPSGRGCTGDNNNNQVKESKKKNQPITSSKKQTEEAHTQQPEKIEVQNNVFQEATSAASNAWTQKFANTGDESLLNKVSCFI